MKSFEKALRARYKHKSQILKVGGEQALSHSPDDLKRIEDALERLRKNSFGFCISCGYEIPKERLRVYPESERCVPCQNEHEKKLN